MSGTFLKVMFDRLIPPVEATPELLAAWRMVVFFSLIILAATVFAHIALTSGWWGVDYAYAKQSELVDLKEEVRGQSRRSLEIDILNLRVRQCKALSGNNPEAARFAGETLQDRRLEYSQMTDRPYPLPTCREVGVDA